MKVLILQIYNQINNRLYADAYSLLLYLKRGWFPVGLAKKEASLKRWIFIILTRERIRFATLNTEFARRLDTVVLQAKAQTSANYR
jgi:hypothetical protein